MEIIIDSKEQKFINAYKKNSAYSDDIVVNFLPVGDIVCAEKGICIERKTLPDFINSVKSGHIQKQALQMKNNFPHSYIIISGCIKSLGFSANQWTINQHLGAIASLVVRYNINILHVCNQSQLITLIDKIINKTDDGKTVDITQTELLKNNISTENMKIKLLTCFDGIGLKKAEKIVDTKPDIIDKIDSLIETMSKH